MKIIIPGKPIPQQRHRHRILNTGRVWAYDPIAREKALIKMEIQSIISQMDTNFEKLTLVDIDFKFYMPVPKYLRKAQKVYAEKELLRHVVKPDVDNLVKTYLDCLVGIVLTDDRAIKITGAQKIYSPEPRVEITIIEGQELLEEDKPPRDASESLVCDKPTSTTIDVPPYSESPLYSGIPQLRDTYDSWKNKDHPSK